jgi:hypothetical protein
MTRQLMRKGAVQESDGHSAQCDGTAHTAVCSAAVTKSKAIAKRLLHGKPRGGNQ